MKRHWKLYYTSPIYRFYIYQMNSQVAFLLLCFVGGTAKVGSQRLGFEPYEGRPEKYSKVRFCARILPELLKRICIFLQFTVAIVSRGDLLGKPANIKVENYGRPFVSKL